METIDAKNTSADYTDAVTIQNVWDSNGGFAIVTGADVFLELQYGAYGTSDWTREVHIPQNSPIVLDKGTIGVRFRDYKSGVHATISGALASASEPPIVLTNPGTVKVSGQPTFDPATYGAKGDNSTDDTAAWQSAVNAAAAVGGMVLPTPPTNGAWYIKNSITIPDLSQFTGHLVISGSGCQLRTDQAIPIFKRTIADVSQAAAAIGNCADLTFANMVLTGSSLAGQKGIQIHASYNLRLEQIEWVNLDYGADLIYCLKALIVGTRASGCLSYDINLGSGFGTWTGSPGVSAGYGCNASTILSHRSYASTGQTAQFRVYNTEDVAILHSICEGFNPVNCIAYDDAGSTVTKNLTVRGLHVENAPSNAIIGAGITGSLEIDQLYTDQANVTWVDTTFGSGARTPLTITITNCPLFPSGNKIGKNPVSPAFQWILWQLGLADSTDFKAAANWTNAPARANIADIKEQVFDWQTVKTGFLHSNISGANANTGLTFTGNDTLLMAQTFLKVQSADGVVTAFEMDAANPLSGSSFGAFGATPVAQPSAQGTATGYTAGATAATFHSDDTYTGNVGTTQYTINGIVAALKTLGWLKT